GDGGLTLRVWQSLPHVRLEELEELRLRSGLGDDLLRVGYLKVFMDGTLGSRTARMLDGSGVEITSRDELAEIVRRAARAGWPVAVHAIGDLANRDALDAFEETAAEWRPRGLRQRIEHAQCLAADDLPRFARIGVAASVQFSHAPSDRDLADRLWAGKTDGAYAYRSLRESGALVANGSDAPIEELDPLAGIRAGVLRTLDERPGWHPEQALSIEHALEATTVAPARLTGDEQRRGVDDRPRHVDREPPCERLVADGVGRSRDPGLADPRRVRVARDHVREAALDQRERRFLRPAPEAAIDGRGRQLDEDAGVHEPPETLGIPLYLAASLRMREHDGDAVQP